jgi:hypothetical protein
MDDVGLEYQPDSMNISVHDLRISLKNCRSFVSQRQLWFSILNIKKIDDGWIDWATADFGWP